MKPKFLIVFFLLSVCWLRSVKAYSLLTHEAIIDASWEQGIRPLLLAKYPASSPEQLLEAHSYAYGGAIMPDIGYSPFGSMIYTDFVHNVRTGDYVEALLEEAETLNEYAFALGSLAHYMADNYGHELGTNVAVPLVYPKVKEEFGNVVTYADHKVSHSRMELAFDVLQTARGNYASKDYHDFIGFNVARPVVEKAFYRVYGIDVNDVFGSMSVAISTFRWTIKSLLPNIVRTAWASKKDDLRKTDSTLTARKFSYRMKNRTYYHEFGRDHQKAGFFPTVISFIMPFLPKIGPLAKLKFKAPTPEAEALFIKSFDTTLVHYKAAITRLNSSSVDLPNRTLDTGHKTVFGEYVIADDNYATLLFRLQEKDFAHLSAEIKDNLLAFYAGAQPSGRMSKKKAREWKKVQDALEALNQVSTIAAR
ncbi:zinc dependent phospholipase C family protein [Paradesertivirga mongoliensis]|uniref:Zinc dependent phospholipase C family protein n=1 Tax=Paradesertivirga mongoliensis TaxID=2100740 RepID=A0ABW4ZQW1_9SPHI|nr:zinc dependent phospholipase C family protein [Pedobacter mongoliensis]